MSEPVRYLVQQHHWTIVVSYGFEAKRWNWVCTMHKWRCDMHMTEFMRVERERQLRLT